MISFACTFQEITDAYGDGEFEAFDSQITYHLSCVKGFLPTMFSLLVPQGCVATMETARFV